MAERNPPWTRDELILALDLYTRFRPKTPAKNGPEVAELSTLLNLLQRALSGEIESGTLRNVNGVYMKLMNFRAADPALIEAGRAGLKAGNALEKPIWDRYADKPEELAATAKAIRTAIQDPGFGIEKDPFVADSDAEAEAEEGRVLSRMHLTRERSRKLVKERKKLAKAEHGKLACEACGFDFLVAYGERGDGFIECHHTKPLSTLEPGGRTHVRDLAVICANCHRMIHARAPWLTVPELKRLVRARTTPK